MRRIRNLLNIVSILLIIPIVFTVGMRGNISIIFAVILVLWNSIGSDLIMRYVISGKPQVDGKVIELDEARINGRVIMTVEFIYDGSQHRIYQTEFEDQAPILGTSVKVLVEPQNISDSFIWKQCSNKIYYLISIIIVVSLLVYKLLHNE